MGSGLREAAERLLGLVRGDQPASRREAAADTGMPGDEVAVVEEWMESGQDEEGSVLGWHANPVLGWYRTEAAEGRDPNVGPAPRPGGPRPGSPRPGGPRPGVRPSGPPAE